MSIKQEPKVKSFETRLFINGKVRLHRLLVTIPSGSNIDPNRGQSLSTRPMAASLP